MAEIIFKSGLKDQFDSFVQYKKGTQRWNRSSEYFLCCFDKFCAENYPTTNLEATACGTPVVTYRTGGSPESCRPENVVEQGNLEELIAVIKRICE